MSFARFATLAILIAACGPGGGAHRSVSDHPAKALVGVWTAQLHLVAGPPMVKPGVPDVTATVSLIEDADGARATNVAGAVHHGTFAADFLPFGFDLRERGVVPVSAARVADDSVTIVLGATEPERISMKGRFAADTIAGRWSYFGHASGASGTFVLRRYVAR